MATISEAQYQTLAGTLVDNISAGSWATAWSTYAQLYATALGLMKSMSFESASQTRADLDRFREILTAAEGSSARPGDDRRLIRVGVRATP